MFSKFFQKNPIPPSSAPPSQPQAEGNLIPEDINPRVTFHYGIPSTASLLAFDPIQSLLAIATLDGRIKVIGGTNIEGLLISPKNLPFKNLEFLQNQGLLASVSSDNEIQIWDLERRQIASSLQWECSITAFSIIHGTSYIYVGDEYGMVSVLKYETEEVRLTQLPYYVPTNAIAEASGTSPSDHQPVVGALLEPSSQGNRLLIAFQDGVIILWDISEDKVILVRGNKDLLLKSGIIADSDKDMEHDGNGSDNEQMEKEISSLCWASDNGSVLAVGYVDGDIMLWNLSATDSVRGQRDEKSSNNVVKLQLSSGDRRIPVIVLHWSANSSRDCCGQLFVYGGDTIGSEEVLTILSLDWSYGLESLKCIGRTDLTLNGSFADMVLLPRAATGETTGAFVLTSPGQLDFYDDACLSSLTSQQERKTSVGSIQYQMVIPTMEPVMTVGMFSLVHKEWKSSRSLSEAISAAKRQTAHASGYASWPLTGGVPCQQFDTENYQIERVYIAGYQDGSVRIWDATDPTLLLLHVLGPEMKGINIAGASASVSALEFCSLTISLAVGNDLGMVYLYKLTGSVNETSLNIIRDTEKEVHNLHQGDGMQCTAVFSLLNSPVCALQFSHCGTKLAIGYHCGQVALLDISSSSVLSITDSMSDSSSPVKSVAVRSFLDTISLTADPQAIESKNVGDYLKWLVFILTEDTHIAVIDGNTGSKFWSQLMRSEKELKVISMYILEGSNFMSEVSDEEDSFNLLKNSEAESEPAQSVSCGTANVGQRTCNFLLLLCCEDVLYLHSLKSLKEGDIEPVQRANLLKPCCWISTFKKENKECGLIMLYQNGVIEIRSFPNLDVVRESSLEAILRWNFRMNMDKTICSSDRAQIMLVNGCEFASLSLLAYENDFRVPESLPGLHDKVLAAAVHAPDIFSSSQKKTQGAASHISQAEHNLHLPEVFKINFEHLEGIFSCPPFLKPSAAGEDEGVVELSIDDIDIDEPVIVLPASETTKKDKREKGTEREQLFEGATSDPTPRLRTAEEIKAKYRKEDASTAAARAKDKLVQRQQKLERLSERTEELQSGAENFASMAHELAKQMEKRKWWNI